MFGGKLSSERIYGTIRCSSQLVTNLNLKAMHQLLNATQIQPIPFTKIQGTDMTMMENDAGKDYSDLFTRNAQMLNEMPFRLKKSIIFNVPEVYSFNFFILIIRNSSHCFHSFTTLKWTPTNMRNAEPKSISWSLPGTM